MDWFLYDKDLHLERVKQACHFTKNEEIFNGKLLFFVQCVAESYMTFFLTRFLYVFMT